MIGRQKRTTPWRQLPMPRVFSVSSDGVEGVRLECSGQRADVKRQRRCLLSGGLVALSNGGRHDDRSRPCHKTW